MRHIINLIFLTLIFSLYSCSSNDDEVTEPQPNLNFEFSPVSGVLGDTITINFEDPSLIFDPKVYLGDSLATIISSDDGKINFTVPFYVEENNLTIKIESKGVSFLSATKFKVLDPISRAIEGFAFIETDVDSIPLIAGHTSGMKISLLDKPSSDDSFGILMETENNKMLFNFSNGFISEINLTSGNIYFQNQRQDTVDIAFVNKLGEIAFIRNYRIEGLKKFIAGGRTESKSTIDKLVGGAAFVTNIYFCGSGIAGIGGATALGGVPGVAFAIIEGANLVATCNQAINDIADILRLEPVDELRSTEVAAASNLLSFMDLQVNCFFAPNKVKCIKGLVGNTVDAAKQLSDKNSEEEKGKKEVREILDEPCSLTITAGIDSQGTITLTALGGTPPFKYSLNNSTDVVSNSSVQFPNQEEGFYVFWVLDSKGCFKTSEKQLIFSPDCSGVNISFEAKIDSEGTILISDWKGGVPPYEFSVNGSPFQTNSAFDGNYEDGSFNIRIRDSQGCEDGKIVNLTRDDQCDPEFSANAVVNNSSITINVSGGTPPYKYSIDGSTYVDSNIFTNLENGDYTVYVKDSENCMTEKNFTINNGVDCTQSDLSIAITISGSNVTITGSGGTAAYLYSIDGVIYSPSNIFLNVSDGEYTAYIKDNTGCIVSKNFVIGQEGGVCPIILDGTISGSGVTISASGGIEPYYYSLDYQEYSTNNSFTGLDPDKWHFVGVYDSKSVLDPNWCNPRFLFQFDKPFKVDPICTQPVVYGDCIPCDLAISSCQSQISDATSSDGTVVYSRQDIEYSEFENKLNGLGSKEKPISGYIKLRIKSNYFSNNPVVNGGPLVPCSITTDELVTISFNDLFSLPNREDCSECFKWPLDPNYYGEHPNVQADNGYKVSIGFQGQFSQNIVTNSVIDLHMSKKFNFQNCPGREDSQAGTYLTLRIKKIYPAPY